MFVYKLWSGYKMGLNDHVDKKPRKKAPLAQSGGVAASYDAAFIGYINLTLSEEQKSAFPDWQLSASAIDSLEAFTGDGINFSLKTDTRSGGFLASATQRRSDSPNAGYVVTARAREAYTAFWRVVYCVVLLSHAERWTDIQPMASPDRW
jgi:hypothetical protein